MPGVITFYSNNVSLRFNVYVRGKFISLATESKVVSRHVIVIVMIRESSLTLIR